MTHRLLDSALALLLVALEAAAVLGWLFRGAWANYRGANRRPHPPSRVAAELTAGTLYFGATAFGLLRLHLPIAAAAQGAWAALSGTVLVVGLLKLLHR